jgi:hypothetical protein
MGHHVQPLFKIKNVASLVLHKGVANPACLGSLGNEVYWQIGFSYIHVFGFGVSRNTANE